MPVRDKAVARIAELMVGGLTFDGLTGRCTSMPDRLYRLLKFTADDAYEQVVMSIDWSRVYLDASARHQSLHDGDFDSVCGNCMMEAVLANEWGGKTSDKWADHPEAPRWRWPRFRERPENLRARVMALVVENWTRPEVAEDTELDDDQHMPGCFEQGRGRESKIICDPRCPSYDGWVERLTGDA